MFSFSERFLLFMAMLDVAMFKEVFYKINKNVMTKLFQLWTQFIEPLRSLLAEMKQLQQIPD
jgi:hypothetical protein